MAKQPGCFTLNWPLFIRGPGSRLVSMIGLSYGEIMLLDFVWWSYRLEYLLPCCANSLLCFLSGSDTGINLLILIRRYYITIRWWIFPVEWIEIQVSNKKISTGSSINVQNMHVKSWKKSWVLYNLLLHGQCQ